MVGGKCIAMATSCTFHISAQVESASTKDDANDLLNRVPVAAGTNLTNYLLMNVGDMENSGIEVALNVVPFD